MTQAILHYIFDPLCGWCYGAAPLLEAARGLAGIDVVFHGGGMMTGSNRRQITPQWRNYVLPHDRRIAEMTGQPFGDAYLNGLLKDGSALMDSEPPITATLAAEALGGRGLDMLHRLQTAHYVDGLRIADAAVLRALAQEIGLDGAAFEAAYAEQSGAATQRHIEASRALLNRVGGQGFPTFALDDGTGKLTVLDLGAYLGRPREWLARLAQVAAPAPGAAEVLACGPDSCALPD
ncbi:DsbA family protein [Rugamonas sp.]|uniref:DsbA family protein n=1 Tax=Rugamonas sp. TaxID=1926287 RepID=UPI0025EBA9CF|nr:DsbA family protein [Rugamonas sp.]